MVADKKESNVSDRTDLIDQIEADIKKLPVPRPKSAPSVTDGFEKAVASVLEILESYR